MGKLIIFSAPFRVGQVHNYQLSVDAEPESGFLYFGNQPSAARHGAERGGVFLSHSR